MTAATLQATGQPPTETIRDAVPGSVSTEAKARPATSAAKTPWSERDEGWLTKAEVAALVEKILAPIKEALARV